MSTDPPPKPRRTGPRLLGLAAVAGLITVAVLGIEGRDRSEAKLVTWTAEQAIPTVALVAPKPLLGARELTLPGTVQAYYDSPIFARVSGYLKSWQRDIGAHVKRGEVLAEIDTPELEQQLNQAVANLARAQADQKLAVLTASRWHALLASKSVSQQSVDEKEGAADEKLAAVRAAQADVDRLRELQKFRTITAPFDGVVTARKTDIGALIDAGSGHGAELFRVADLHEMRIYVAVPQADSAELVQGTAAELTMPQYPGRAFPAKLETTANAVNEQSRTVLFELLAPNPDGELLPGTFAEVHFKLPPTPGHLEIPNSAVIFQESGTELALLGANDKVVLKPVELGRNSGTTVEVLSGLSADDKVIDSPPDSLSAGDTVRPLMASGEPKQVAQEASGAQ